MVSDAAATPDPLMVRAQRKFYKAYGLPEFANPVTKPAAKEFLAASRAGRVPGWVISLAEIGEIRDAAG